MLFWNFKISICKKIIIKKKIELFIIQTCNFRVLPCFVAYIFFYAPDYRVFGTEVLQGFAK